MTRRRYSLRTPCGTLEGAFSLPRGARLVTVGPSAGRKPLDTKAAAGLLNRGGWEHQREPLFVVNDHQRATPTSLILSLLDPPVAAWPRARFIVASGSHHPPDAGELARIFGADLLPALEGRILFHDARGRDLAGVGRTSRGTEVEVSPRLFEAEALVTIGSVEPHYFAGYTGGRKSIVPGLASFGTIKANHRLALEAGARPLALAGNPLHLDLEEACALALREAEKRGLRRVTAVNVVNLGSDIHFVDKGELPGSVERARAAADEVYVREVPRRFPVVVAAAGSPLNLDFYQALKAFEHGRCALARGGTLILVAPCDQGLGPRHFAGLLREVSASGPEKFSVEDYELSAHKIANLLSFLRGGMRLFLVSAADLPSLGEIGVRRFSSLNEALEEAVRAAGEASPGVLVVEEATTVVPRVSGEAGA